jgi:hypothetical protein
MQEADEKRRHLGFDQLRIMQGVGQVVSRLKADDRWRVYGEHVEAVEQRYREMAERAAAKLLNGEFLDAKEYGVTKTEHVRASAWAEALKFAVDIAQVLVEQGDKAGEELAKLLNK